MKKIILISCILLIFTVIYSFTSGTVEQNPAIYNVKKLSKPLNIDGNWDKAEWKDAPELEIVNYMGAIPGFQPETKAKMMYDDINIYVIFQVKDRYVRCLSNKINGPVWQDSAVEFFFSPDSELPLLYFNLETNCGGTPLMHYNVVPRKESKRLATEEIKQIEIAHSLPEIIDPELSDPVTWTLEYRIPLSLLEKYSRITRPGKGVEWRANFYKIAENSSNPHYITWSEIDKPKPDFHVPQSFGKLKFE